MRLGVTLKRSIRAINPFVGQERWILRDVLLIRGLARYPLPRMRKKHRGETSAYRRYAERRNRRTGEDARGRWQFCAEDQP